MVIADQLKLPLAGGSGCQASGALCAKGAAGRFVEVGDPPGVHFDGIAQRNPL